MPVDETGRITLAVLGEKIDSLTSIIAAMSRQIDDLKGDTQRIAVLEYCQERNDREIESLKKHRSESRLVDAVVAVATAYSMLGGRVP